MSTLIFYECRDPLHLAAPSRLGLGGIVFRHGTAAYCDGTGVDAAHHWFPTGGVPLEKVIGTARTQMQLWEDRDVDGRTRTRYIPNAHGATRPLTVNP